MLAVTSVLLLIFLSSIFIRFLGYVASGELQGESVFHLVTLKGISHLGIILPLSYFFAVLLTLGRFYRDHEMTALNACGIGQMGVAKSVLLTTPVVISLVAFLSLYASPWAARKGVELQQQAEERSELSTLIAGRFKESKAGDLIMYVEKTSADNKQMQNVFVQNREGKNIHVLSSESAYLYTRPENGDEFMVMVNGYRYKGEPGSADYRIIKFEKHAVRIDQKEVESKRLKRTGMPTSALWQADEPKLVAEFQRRLIIPFGALLMVLLAIPLSHSSPREGRFARLFSAVLIYIIYNNLMNVAQSWLEQGHVPRAIGLWWVPFLLVAGTLVFVVLQNRKYLWWLDTKLRKRVYG